MTTDERAVAALERIAVALEQIAGVTPALPAGDWVAAPMAKCAARGARPVFHAVRPRAGRLVTACAASGRSGDVDKSALRELADVPRLDLSAWRCGAAGCREVFTRYPARTESS